MPLQNRVTPESELIFAPWRGQFTGNRGRLMRTGDGCLGTTRWRHPHWITCTLNRREGHDPLPLTSPRHYTPLFFPDEAVACAAGHRPCAECRRPVWLEFRAAYSKVYYGIYGTHEVDDALHPLRTTRHREQITYEAEAKTLPFGAFFRLDGRPHLRTDHGIKPFDSQTALYGAETEVPPGFVEVLTPRPIVATMAAGFRPVMSAAEDRPGWGDHKG